MRRYARSELRQFMLLDERPHDAPLPGAQPRYRVGDGAQLYVRTKRYAYTAYLRKQCPTCRPGYKLLDETLYDHTTDAGETVNLAYAASHYGTRREMLAAQTPAEITSILKRQPASG